MYDELFLWIFTSKLETWNIGIVCMALGTSISCFVALYYREIDALAKKTGSTRYFLVSRVYSILKFLTALLYWKGLLKLIDKQLLFSFNYETKVCLIFWIMDWPKDYRMFLTSQSLSPPVFSSSSDHSRVPPSRRH